jgi:hypothetical protein
LRDPINNGQYFDQAKAYAEEDDENIPFEVNLPKKIEGY